MVHIDTTQPDRVLRAGIDLWEIMKAEDDKSAKGDPMIVLKMFRVSDPADHLYERLMLAGNGWPVGKKKLGALVAPGFKGELDLIGLVGVRLWVSTGIEQYKGRDQYKVQIQDLRCAGLQPSNEVPPGCALPAKSDADESVPF